MRSIYPRNICFKSGNNLSAFIPAEIIQYGNFSGRFSGPGGFNNRRKASLEKFLPLIVKNDDMRFYELLFSGDNKHLPSKIFPDAAEEINQLLFPGIRVRSVIKIKSGYFKPVAVKKLAENFFFKRGDVLIVGNHTVIQENGFQ